MRAIVVGHGDFAAGLVSAVAQITGQGDQFLALSNRDCGAPELEQLLLRHVDATGASVIFTDLPAGSCAMAARRAQRARAALWLVTGVNLALLLDYAFHGDLPPGEAVGQALEKARASLAIMGATSAG